MNLINNETMLNILKNTITIDDLEPVTKSLDVNRQVDGNAIKHIMNIIPNMFEYFIQHNDKKTMYPTEIKDDIEVCQLVVLYLKYLGYNAIMKPYYKYTDKIFTVEVSLKYF